MMKKLFVLLLALLMMTSSAMAWGEKSTAELYEEAEVLLKDGNVILRDEWRRVGNARNDGWGSSYNTCKNAAPDFSDGRIRVQTPGEMYGFMDNTGKAVGQIVWSSIGNFSEGLAVVFRDGKAGYIDMDGQVVIDPQYADAKAFSDGLAAVELGSGKWMYIDSANNTVIPAMFTDAYSFCNGRADVLLGNFGWMVIDKTGKLLYFRNDETIAAYDAAYNSASAPAPVQSSVSQTAAQAGVPQDEQIGKALCKEWGLDESNWKPLLTELAYYDLLAEGSSPEMWAEAIGIELPQLN